MQSAPIQLIINTVNMINKEAYFLPFLRLEEHDVSVVYIK